MVPLLSDFVLDPISVTESGDPQRAMTVEAGFPTHTILYPPLQRRHDGSAETVPIPKKHVMIIANDKTLMDVFMATPLKQK